MVTTPLEVYRAALAERRRLESSGRTSATRFAALRLAIFVAGLALGWLAFSRGFSWYWLLAPAVLFAAALRLHDRVLRRLARAGRAVAFFEKGLARMEDRWAGQGTSGDEFADAKHPYASDLDLFGKGSLFELLCAARTHDGERTLAGWLLRRGSAAEIRARQQAIDELRPRLDLREDLAVLGEDVRSSVHTDALARWASAPAALAGGWRAPVAAALALANVVTAAAWLAGMRAGLPFLGACLVSATFAWLHGERARRVLHAVERPAAELRVLAEILERLEAERFSSVRLRELRERLEVRGVPPSRRIARLAQLVDWSDSRKNQLFAPLAALLLLGTQLALALERWRASSGVPVGAWLEAVGEIEALASLAAFADEHPDDPFPEIVESGPLFEADALGHPLLPAARCVRNDVRLDPELRLLLVSGSNMSGKSTLLRSAGVNAVLALAGAPVRAERLRLSVLEVGACMRVQDSLQEGTSHFYAEILRLRALVDLGGHGTPLLFLLDEILHGTNSHDRGIGAEALVRGLVARGGIGLVTTHDLALARIADEMAPRAANVHFEDRLEGDRIVFDYRLRAGVVRKSNALELMRAIGLEI